MKHDRSVRELDTESNPSLLLRALDEVGNEAAKCIGVALLPIGQGLPTCLNHRHRVTVHDRHVFALAFEPQLDVVMDELHGVQPRPNQSPK